MVVRGICMSDRMPSCMRAPPEAANRMKGVRFSTARSMPVMTASPAAMPSEPAMKRKSCAAATTSWPSSLPSADEHGVLELGVRLGGLETIGVAPAVAEFQGVVRRPRGTGTVSYSPLSKSAAGAVCAAMRM